MVWMVRWVAEFISKHPRGDDGKSPYERARGEPSRVPLVPFGETTVYLHMKIVKRQNAEAAKLQGIWLGINECTDGTLIGTEKGAIKCRIVSRLNSGGAWGKGLLSRIKGVPWNPVPGKEDVRTSVEIINDGGIICDAGDYEQPQGIDDDDDQRDDTPQ